jgi:hypothetical protein
MLLIMQEIYYFVKKSMLYPSTSECIMIYDDLVLTFCFDFHKKESVNIYYPNPLTTFHFAFLYFSIQFFHGLLISQ